MKKIYTFLIIFFLFPIITLAGGSSDDGISAAGSMTTKTCYYKNVNANNQTQVVSMTIYGIDVTTMYSVSIESYYYNEGSTQKNQKFFVDNFDGTNYIYNNMYDYGVKFALNNHMMQIATRLSEGETDILESDNSEICPKKAFEIEYIKNNKKEYMYFLCNGYNSELGVETCTEAKNFINSTDDFGDNPSITELSYSHTDAFTNLGGKDTGDTNANDVYNDLINQRDEVCDESSDKYDFEKCRDLNEQIGGVVDRAEDAGQKLYLYDDNLIKPLRPNKLNCSGPDNSLLGVPTCPNGRNCDPAFYLQFVFNVMKYVAIIILIVMTILDFTKATASKDDDAMKKSVNKCITRIILCMILFILPTLLEFIFTWLNVYRPSVCGIS